MMIYAVQSWLGYPKGDAGFISGYHIGRYMMSLCPIPGDVKGLLAFLGSGTCDTEIQGSEGQNQLMILSHGLSMATSHPSLTATL